MKEKVESHFPCNLQRFEMQWLMLLNWNFQVMVLFFTIFIQIIYVESIVQWYNYFMSWKVERCIQRGGAELNGNLSSIARITHVVVMVMNWDWPIPLYCFACRFTILTEAIRWWWCSTPDLPHWTLYTVYDDVIEDLTSDEETMTAETHATSRMGPVNLYCHSNIHCYIANIDCGVPRAKYNGHLCMYDDQNWKQFHI